MAFLCVLVQVYVVVLFARIILSWFPIQPGGGMASAYSFLYTITEPVLAPLRRILPPLRAGGMGFDLSPIIVLLVLQLVLPPLLCS